MLSASKIQESLKKMSELVNHALCVLQSKDAIVLLPAAAYHKPLKDELQKLLAATVDPLMVCADSYTVPVEYLMSAKCTPLFELERFISLYPSAVTQILDVYQRRAHQTYTLSLSLPTMFKNLRLECYDLNNSKLNNFFDQKGAIIKNQRRMGGYLSFMQVYHADLENKDKTEYEAKIYCFIQYAKTILKKNEQINFKRFLDETVKIFGSRLENVIETLKEKVEPKNEKLCEFLGYILEENRKAPIKAEKPPVLSAEVVESSSKEIESVFVTIQKNSKAILAVYAEKKLEKTLFHQYCTILKNIDVSPLINLSTHLNSSCLTKYIPKYLMSDKSKLLFDFLLFCCIHQQNLKEICDEQKMLFLRH